MDPLIELILEKHWKKIKKKPNVIGIDGELRPKIKNGITYPQIKSIRIYVSKKVPFSQFLYSPSLWTRIKHRFRRNPMLKSDLVPAFIDGIPTDLIVIGEIRADRKVPLNPKQRYRPMIAGVSACHKDGTACTSTCFVLYEEKVLLALNNHCGALENKARIGDSWLGPSPYDGGGYPEDEIAKLHHFVELKFNGFACPWRNSIHSLYRFFKRDLPINKVDISFGELTVGYSIEALQIEDAFRDWKDPELEESVQKTGRTTGYTTGKVASLNWIGSVGYSRGTVQFTDCILIEGRGFSAGGDSGSPVFDMQGNLVGILFAGSDTYTILCKIGNVETEGRVKIITLTKK